MEQGCCCYREVLPTSRQFPGGWEGATSQEGAGVSCCGRMGTSGERQQGGSVEDAEE